MITLIPEGKPISTKTPYTALGLTAGTAGYEVGAPCTNSHEKTNKWSERKPIAVAQHKDGPDVDNDTLRESDTVNGYYYGVKIIIKNPCEIHDSAFEYAPPQKGINWFRLTDWCGYDGKAKPYPIAVGDWIDTDSPVEISRGMAFTTTFKLAFEAVNQNGINILKCIAGSNWQNQNYYPILIISSVPQEETEDNESDTFIPAFWAKAMTERDSGITKPLDLSELADQQYYIEGIEDNFVQNDLRNDDDIIAEARSFFLGNYIRRVSIAFITVSPEATGLMNNGMEVDLSKWTRLDYISGIENGIGIPFLPLPFATSINVRVNGISMTQNTPGVIITKALADNDGITVTAVRNGDFRTCHAISLTIHKGGTEPKSFIRIFDEDYQQSGLDYSIEESYFFDWQQDLDYQIPGMPPDAEQLSVLWKTYTGTQIRDDELFRTGSLPVNIADNHTGQSNYPESDLNDSEYNDMQIKSTDESN